MLCLKTIRDKYKKLFLNKNSKGSNYSSYESKGDHIEIYKEYDGDNEPYLTFSMIMDLGDIKEVYYSKEYQDDELFILKTSLGDYNLDQMSLTISKRVINKMEVNNETYTLTDDISYIINLDGISKHITIINHGMVIHGVYDIDNLKDISWLDDKDDVKIPFIVYTNTPIKGDGDGGSLYEPNLIHNVNAILLDIIDKLNNIVKNVYDEIDNKQHKKVLEYRVRVFTKALELLAKFNLK